LRGDFKPEPSDIPSLQKPIPWKSLKKMIRDAVSCHFDAASKPSVIRLNMVKDEVIPA
jgi:hypothetical protein